MSSFPVRYSSRAYYEYENILDYIVNKFGQSVALRVDLYFEEVISQISVNPFLFPVSDKLKQIRRCVISKQTTLYYRFNGEFIEIVSFRGNMMNPTELNL
jgi:plasmid stabilization system protein ParE